MKLTYEEQEKIIKENVFKKFLQNSWQFLKKSIYSYQSLKGGD